MATKPQAVPNQLDNSLQGITYRNACAAVKIVGATQVLDLTEDEYDFLTRNQVWSAQERSRARRCVEASVYGTLDYLGYPRFAVPAEFIAASIAFYVNPVNFMTAALIMEGAEFSENIINGVERPLKAKEIFAHVCRLIAGDEYFLNRAKFAVDSKLRTASI